MSRHLIVFIVLLGVLASTGCAPPNLASVSAHNIARRFETPANKSHIYVIRLSQGKGAVVPTKVNLNNKYVGELWSSTFTMIELDPGQYEIKIWLQGSFIPPKYPLANQLNCLPGKSYYFLTEIWGMRVITKEEAKEYVVEYEMVENSTFPTKF